MEKILKKKNKALFFWKIYPGSYAALGLQYNERGFWYVLSQIYLEKPSMGWLDDLTT